MIMMVSLAVLLFVVFLLLAALIGSYRLIALDSLFTPVAWLPDCAAAHRLLMHHTVAIVNEEFFRACHILQIEHARATSGVR